MTQTITDPRLTGHPITLRNPADLIPVLAEAGLVGLGGAGFPVHRKLAAARGQAPRLIVNACEGEPLSVKDRWILEHAPDPLLAGIRAVAAAVGASRIVLAVHRDSATEHAAQQLVRSSAGVELLSVAAGYVASEASALTSALDGGPATPFSHRLPLAVRQGRPGRRRPATLVHNVETIYRIGQLLGYGLDWFRSFGTPDEPGPRFFSLSGAVADPAVGAPRLVQAGAGSSLSDLIDAAGGLRSSVRAVLAGGWGGGWIDWSTAQRLDWSQRSLTRVGSGLGNGIVYLLPADHCPLTVVGDQLSALAAASARQCGPCLFGLPAVSRDWNALVSGDGESSGAQVEQRLRRRLGLLPGRGGCHHPDGAARNAGTALGVFADHLAEHRGMR